MALVELSDPQRDGRLGSSLTLVASEVGFSVTFADPAAIGFSHASNVGCSIIFTSSSSSPLVMSITFEQSSFGGVETGVGTTAAEVDADDVDGG